MPGEEPEKGDKGNTLQTRIALLSPLAHIVLIVSWNWSGGQPSGTVAETKTEGEIAIKSKRGNTIKKNASPSNPAVHVSRSGNDVVKRASELQVDEKASGSVAPNAKSPTPASKENGNGDKKREHDEVDGADEDIEEEKAEDEKAEAKKEPPAKKQKKEPAKKKEKVEKEKPTPAEKKEEKKKEEKTQANGEDIKKGRGRPKGTTGAASSSAATKKKKDSKPRATEGIGSRTRSRT